MAAEWTSQVTEPRLPEGWREAALNVVADVRFSSVDKLTHPSEEPVRLCNYIDVYKNSYITGNLEFMRASATQPEIDRFGLRVGDVIITKDSETPDDIGVPAVVEYAARDLVCGYHLGLIRPDKSEVDPTFLAKQLSHHRIARYFGRQANGLTRYGLPIGAVLGTPLRLPGRREQNAIGALLRLVDEVIAKTEAVIAKLEQVRAGLLHDLLTRGIDEHGQLRDPTTQPDQFQDSPLGRIPRAWRVASVDELLAPVPNAMRSGPFGSALLKQELRSLGIPLLGIDNVYEELFVANFSRFVDEEKYEELKRYAVRPGDVMITIMGTVGRCCVVPDGIGKALSSKHVWTITIDRRCYSPTLACWQLNYAPWVLSQLRRDEQGGVMSAIRSETLRRLLLPVPGPDEIKAIDAALATCSHAITVEKNELSKLHALRSALMTDLLTGRVRVPESFVPVEITK